MPGLLASRLLIAIPAWAAIVISLLSLSVGWLLYDNLCKSRLAENPTVLMVILFVILVVMAWGYTQVFSGRAALLHLGASVTCSHTGAAKPATTNSRVTVSGQPTALLSALTV